MPSLAEAYALYSLNPADRVDIGPINAADGPRRQGEVLYEAFKSDLLLVRLGQIAWSYYRDKINGKGDENSQDLQQTMTNILNETGLREVLVNTVVQIYENNYSLSNSSAYCNAPIIARQSKDESIECIKQVRIEWEQGINEELMAIAQEMSRPFVIARAKGVYSRIIEGEMPHEGPKRDAIRFLFDSEDLLETSIGIRSANAKAEYATRMLGMVKLQLRTSSLFDLQKKYSDLAPTYTQIGLDEKWLASGGLKFSLFRHEEGDAIASFGTALDARKFMRRGVPTSLRQRVWRIAIALPDNVTSEETRSFNKLRNHCENLDILTDMLYMHDVDNVTDDPRFFVFEEELKECTLCFSRDPWVAKHATYCVHAPMQQLASQSSDASGENTGSQVHPFLGFSIYVAPLCYIYRNRAALYMMSRALWARIWCKLNVISGDAGTLLHVCATFENLLSTMHPTLFLHLLRIGVQPLLIAMPWLQFGFVGLLEIPEVLHLWDRVIGYEDPCLLAVVAVGVFLIRAETVMGTKVPAEAVQILMEGSRLKVVSLLQMVLFADSSDSNRQI